MKNQNSSAHGRYVSVEKVQQVFADLGIQICSGRKRVRATRDNNSISIHVNGGTVNIIFEKGDCHEG